MWERCGVPYPKLARAFCMAPASIKWPAKYKPHSLTVAWVPVYQSAKAPNDAVAQFETVSQRTAGTVRYVQMIPVVEIYKKYL